MGQRTDPGNGADAGRPPPALGGRAAEPDLGGLAAGGLGVCVIVGSAVIGAVATIVTKSQPGSVLGLFVLAGTVAAALTVQPRTGRLIFPVPALSYLIAALTAGVVYDRAADKTEIAVGAAQWIASGFFVMVLSTLLAIALTTVRWYMWRRDQRGPAAPDWSATAPRPPAGPPRRPGRRREHRRARSGPQWPPGSPRDQRPGPRPDQRPGLTPGQRSRIRALQLLQRGVAQHQVLDPVVGPEVDLGLGLVAVAVRRYHGAEPELVVRDQVPADSDGTGRFPGDRVPGLLAIRSCAGATAEAAAASSRRHSMRPGGISARNLDRSWNEGRPYQFLRTAQVRYRRCMARVMPT